MATIIARGAAVSTTRGRWGLDRSYWPGLRSEPAPAHHLARHRIIVSGRMRILLGVFVAAVAFSLTDWVSLEFFFTTIQRPS